MIQKLSVTRQFVDQVSVYDRWIITKMFRSNFFLFRRSSNRRIISSMEDLLSTAMIEDLPLTGKEIRHPGRTRQGYHVFLSYWNIRFKKLGEEEKKELLGRYYVVVVGDGMTPPLIPLIL